MSTIDQNEFQRIWVDALRSGNFLQARGALTDDIFADPDDRHSDILGLGYCCLGVGIEIDPLIVNFDDGVDKDQGEDIPSCEVLARWGLSYETANLLAKKNDGTGMPKEDFPQIADFIAELDMVPYPYVDPDEDEDEY